MKHQTAFDKFWQVEVLDLSVAHVGDGDFLSSLDGLLREEDLDLEVAAAEVGRVRNAGVVDARQPQADNLEKDIRTYWCIRTATLGHKKTLPCKDLGLKPLIYLRHKQFPNEAHDRVLSRLFVEKIKNDQEG